jgi:hypothetical protein
MMALQLFSMIFGLYMLYWCFLIYKKKLIYVREFVFWIVVWLVFMIVVMFPDSTKTVLQTFKINRTMDLLMIVTFVVLWFITFRNYVENKQQKRKLQDLVRNLAIKSALKNKENK